MSLKSCFIYGAPPRKEPSQIVFNCIPVPLFCLFHSLSIFTIGVLITLSFVDKRHDLNFNQTVSTLRYWLIDGPIGYGSYNKYTDLWVGELVVGFGGIFFSLVSLFCLFRRDYHLHYIWIFYLIIRATLLTFQFILDLRPVSNCGDITVIDILASEYDTVNRPSLFTTQGVSPIGTFYNWWSGESDAYAGQNVDNNPVLQVRSESKLNGAQRMDFHKQQECFQQQLGMIYRFFFHVILEIMLIKVHQTWYHLCRGMIGKYTYLLQGSAAHGSHHLDRWIPADPTYDVYRQQYLWKDDNNMPFSMVHKMPNGDDIQDSYQLDKNDRNSLPHPDRYKGRTGVVFPTNNQNFDNLIQNQNNYNCLDPKSQNFWAKTSSSHQTSSAASASSPEATAIPEYIIRFNDGTDELISASELHANDQPTPNGEYFPRPGVCYIGQSQQQGQQNDLNQNQMNNINVERFERIAGVNDRPLGLDCMFEEQEDQNNSDGQRQSQTNSDSESLLKKLVVVSVKDGTFAQRSGIQVGDEIETITDSHLRPSELSDSDRLKIFQNRPLKLNILRRLKTTSSDNNSKSIQSSTIETLVPETQGPSLGFEFDAVTNSAVRVFGPNSWADDNHVRRGDIIMEIEGIPIQALKEQEIVLLLKTKRPLRMRWKRGPGLSESDQDLLEQQFGRSQQDGFNVNEIDLNDMSTNIQHDNYDYFTVIALKHMVPLGLEFDSYNGIIQIDENVKLVPPSWAAELGLRDGDEILSLDTRPWRQLQEYSPQQWEDLLMIRPLVMRLRRRVSREQALERRKLRFSPFDDQKDDDGDEQTSQNRLAVGSQSSTRQQYKGPLQIRIQNQNLQQNLKQSDDSQNQNEQQELFTVTAERYQTELGMEGSFEFQDGFLVSYVKSRSWASEKGILPGDVLLQVNSRALSDCSYDDDKRRLVRQRPAELLFRRDPMQLNAILDPDDLLLQTTVQQQIPSQKEHDLFQLLESKRQKIYRSTTDLNTGLHGQWVEPGGGGGGVSNSGHTTTIVFKITYVEPLSWASKNNLSIGDYIIAINGVEFSDKRSQQERDEMILNLIPSEWLIEKGPDHHPSETMIGHDSTNSHFFERLIHESDGSMGIEVRWDSMLCIFEVLRIKKDTWGYKNDFKVGDQIIAANSTFFKDLNTLEDCENLLRNRPCTLLVNTEYGQQYSQQHLDLHGHTHSVPTETENICWKYLRKEDIETGLTLRQEDPDDENSEFIVEKVEQYSWAWHVGLSQHDRILSIEGEQLTEQNIHLLLSDQSGPGSCQRPARIRIAQAIPLLRHKRLEAKISEQDGKMGLKVRWLHALHLFEVAEEPNSAQGLWASRVHIKKGDRIVGAGGRSFHEVKTMEECEQLMRIRPTVFKFDRKIPDSNRSRWWIKDKDSSDSSKDNQYIKELQQQGKKIRMVKMRNQIQSDSSGTLGMKGRFLEKRQDKGFLIQSIDQDGWAVRTDFRINDVIVAVNGVSLAECKNTKQRIELLKQQQSATFTVEIDWNDHEEDSLIEWSQKKHLCQQENQLENQQDGEDKDSDDKEDDINDADHDFLKDLVEHQRDGGKIGLQGKYEKDRGEFIIKGVTQDGWGDKKGIKKGDGVVIVDNKQLRKIKKVQNIMMLLQNPNGIWKVRHRNLEEEVQERGSESAEPGAESAAPQEDEEEEGGDAGVDDGEDVKKDDHDGDQDSQKNVNDIIFTLGPNDRAVHRNGVQYTGLQGKFDKETGYFVIQSVDKESWAEQNGIVSGDRVVSVNDESLSNIPSESVIVQQGTTSSSSKTITNENSRRQRIKLLQDPNGILIIRSKPRLQLASKGEYLILRLGERNTGLHGKFQKTDGNFVISNVEADSWAERNGVKQQDLIIAVNGERFEDLFMKKKSQQEQQESEDQKSTTSKSQLNDVNRARIKLLQDPFGEMVVRRPSEYYTTEGILDETKEEVQQPVEVVEVVHDERPPKYVEVIDQRREQEQEQVQIVREQRPPKYVEVKQEPKEQEQPQVQVVHETRPPKYVEVPPQDRSSAAQAVAPDTIEDDSNVERTVQSIQDPNDDGVESESDRPMQSIQDPNDDRAYQAVSTALVRAKSEAFDPEQKVLMKLSQEERSLLMRWRRANPQNQQQSSKKQIQFELNKFDILSARETLQLDDCLYNKTTSKLTNDDILILSDPTRGGCPEPLSDDEVRALQVELTQLSDSERLLLQKYRSRKDDMKPDEYESLFKSLNKLDLYVESETESSDDRRLLEIHRGAPTIIEQVEFEKSMSMSQIMLSQSKSKDRLQDEPIDRSSAATRDSAAEQTAPVVQEDEGPDDDDDVVNNTFLPDPILQSSYERLVYRRGEQTTGLHGKFDDNSSSFHVHKVDPNSWADKNGIQPNDRITHVYNTRLVKSLDIKEKVKLLQDQNGIFRIRKSPNESNLENLSDQKGNTITNNRIERFVWRDGQRSTPSGLHGKFESEQQSDSESNYKFRIHKLDNDGWAHAAGIKVGEAITGALNGFRFDSNMSSSSNVQQTQYFKTMKDRIQALQDPNGVLIVRLNEEEIKKLLNPENEGEKAIALAPGQKTDAQIKEEQEKQAELERQNTLKRIQEMESKEKAKKEQERLAIEQAKLELEAIEKSKKLKEVEQVQEVMKSRALSQQLQDQQQTQQSEQVQEIELESSTSSWLKQESNDNADLEDEESLRISKLKEDKERLRLEELTRPLQQYERRINRDSSNNNSQQAQRTGLHGKFDKNSKSATGTSIGGGDFIIQKIDQDSWASENDIKVGDRIVSVNGIILSNIENPKERIKLLQSMLISQPSQASSSSSDNRDSDRIRDTLDSESHPVFLIRNKEYYEMKVGNDNLSNNLNERIVVRNGESFSGLNGKFDPLTGWFKIHKVDPGSWAEKNGIVPKIDSITGVNLVRFDTQSQQSSLSQQQKTRLLQQKYSNVVVCRITQKDVDNNVRTPRLSPGLVYDMDGRSKLNQDKDHKDLSQIEQQQMQENLKINEEKRQKELRAKKQQDEELAKNQKLQSMLQEQQRQKQRQQDIADMNAQIQLEQQAKINQQQEERRKTQSLKQQQLKRQEQLLNELKEQQLLHQQNLSNSTEQRRLQDLIDTELDHKQEIERLWSEREQGRTNPAIPDVLHSPVLNSLAINKSTPDYVILDLKRQGKQKIGCQGKFIEAQSQSQDKFTEFGKQSISLSDRQWPGSFIIKDVQSIDSDTTWAEQIHLVKGDCIIGVNGFPFINLTPKARTRMMQMVDAVYTIKLRKRKVGELEPVEMSNVILRYMKSQSKEGNLELGIYSGGFKITKDGILNASKLFGDADIESIRYQTQKGQSSSQSISSRNIMISSKKNTSNDQIREANLNFSTPNVEDSETLRLVKPQTDIVIIPKTVSSTGVYGKFDKKTSGTFVVKAVDSGLWGDQNGLKSGDQIVAVDGIDFTNSELNQNSKIKLLRKTDCKVTVKKLMPMTMTMQQSQSVKDLDENLVTAQSRASSSGVQRHRRSSADSDKKNRKSSSSRSPTQIEPSSISSSKSPHKTNQIQNLKQQLYYSESELQPEAEVHASTISNYKSDQSTVQFTCEIPATVRNLGFDGKLSDSDSNSTKQEHDNPVFVIRNIYPGSWASGQKSEPKLSVGDRIVAVNGAPFTKSSESESEISESNQIKLIQQRLSIRPAILTIERDKSKPQLEQVKPTQSPYSFSAILEKDDGPLGLQGSFLSSSESGKEDSIPVFTIFSVKPGLWGARNGVKIGDVIEAINDVNVSSDKSSGSSSGSRKSSSTIPSANKVLKMLQSRPVTLKFKRNSNVEK